MKGYWANLRPFEKRVVMGGAALFFVVLNFLFVFPHFSDLNSVRYRMDEAQQKLAKYESEIGQTNTYQRGLRQMQKEGLDVAAEEQSFQFANAINAQAGQSSVSLVSNGKINTQTNQFFLEKTQSISVQSGEDELVDFLYNLGGGNSLIRVRDLTVRPDPPRQRLVANVTLVASYQKTSTKSSAPPTRAPGSRNTTVTEPPAAAKPATTATLK